MKHLKFLLLSLAYFLILSSLHAQTTPTVKVRSNDSFQLVDNYLIALKRLGIPTGTTDNLEAVVAAPNTAKIMYRTDLSKLRVYNPVTQVWGDASPADFSNYYNKSDIDQLLTGKPNHADVLHKTGNEVKNGNLTLNGQLEIPNSGVFVSYGYNALAGNNQINGGFSSPSYVSGGRIVELANRSTSSNFIYSIQDVGEGAGHGVKIVNNDIFDINNVKFVKEDAAVLINPQDFQNGNISLAGSLNMKTDGQGTFLFAGNRWVNNTLGSNIAMGGTIIYSSAYNHEFFTGDTRALTLGSGRVYLPTKPLSGDNPNSTGFTFLIRSDFDGEVRQISLAELKTLLNN